MKIIQGVSHLDHGLTPAHLEWLSSKFAGRTGFFIETVEMPEGLPSLRCSLYGPAMGDAPVAEEHVSYAVRGNRRCASRHLAGVFPRETRLVTVVAGVVGEDPCVLYTSYGGPEAPREPGDLSLGTMEQILESREFWAKHALSLL